MAKQKKAPEKVVLTNPNGIRVTVGKDAVEKYEKRGYKAATGRSASTSDKK